MTSPPGIGLVGHISQAWRYLPGHLAVFAADESAGSQRGSKARRVLVAEDDHLVAIEVEAALLDAGVEVIGVATSAEEAIELAKAQKPDLVVMDIRLAGPRDGVEAALELFQELGIRCLFATAHQDLATRHRAEAAMPLGWLSKPYQPHNLVRAIERAFAELEDDRE